MPFGNVDLSLGSGDRLTDFDELFREVQLWEILEAIIALLDDEWTGEHEGEVKLFLVHFEHPHYLFYFRLVLLQDSHLSINLVLFTAVLVVEVAV